MCVIFPKADADLGALSPTQTVQRSGKLIAKRGVSPIGYRKLYSLHVQESLHVQPL